MNYITFETGSEVYKLRLNTRNLITLEKLLGGNPLIVLTGYLSQNEIPPMEVMMNIFYSSLLAYQDNITLDKAYDIFDEWLDNGHIIAEFIDVIVEIYSKAGLFQKEVEEKN